MGNDSIWKLAFTEKNKEHPKCLYLITEPQPRASWPPPTWPCPQPCQHSLPRPHPWSSAGGHPDDVLHPPLSYFQEGHHLEVGTLQRPSILHHPTFSLYLKYWLHHSLRWYKRKFGDIIIDFFLKLSLNTTKNFPCSNDHALEMCFDYNQGFPGGASGKGPACQCRRCKRRTLDPWVGKIPCRRAWQPTGKPQYSSLENLHGQRSRAGMGSQRVRHDRGDWAKYQVFHCISLKLKLSVYCEIVTVYWLCDHTSRRQFSNYLSPQTH